MYKSIDWEVCCFFFQNKIIGLIRTLSMVCVSLFAHKMKLSWPQITLENACAVRSSNKKQPTNCINSKSRSDRRNTKQNANNLRAVWVFGIDTASGQFWALKTNTKKWHNKAKEGEREREEVLHTKCNGRCAPMGTKMRNYVTKNRKWNNNKKTNFFSFVYGNIRWCNIADP